MLCKLDLDLRKKIKDFKVAEKIESGLKFEIGVT